MRSICREGRVMQSGRGGISLQTVISFSSKLVGNSEKRFPGKPPRIVHALFAEKLYLTSGREVNVTTELMSTLHLPKRGKKK